MARNDLADETESLITAEYNDGSVQLSNVERPRVNNEDTDTGRSRRRIKLSVAVLSIILVSVSVVTVVILYRHGYWRQNIHIGGETVLTDCGPVEGRVSEVHDVHVFKGIPYAVPPVGKLRWKSPVSLKDGNKCWKGVLQARTYSSACAQLQGKKVFGEEDCLYLNVFTPSLRKGANLPVLVWIHGGYLTMGSAHDTTIAGYYPNAQFVKDMEIVVVSFNYRLNAFGFMALDVLSEASPTKTSGNYGFMDQILALKWIQKNIENFGGDKSRVTLLGQSSGGTSIFALLASDSAQGLFKGVIAMSGSPVFNKTTKDASKDNLIFVKNSNCVRGKSEETLKCLYDLSISEVLHAVPWEVFPYWGMGDLLSLPTYHRFDGAVAVVDGDVVKFPPGELPYHNLKGTEKITVVIGDTAQEVGFDPGKDFQGKPYESLVKYLKQKLSKFISQAEIEEALKLYSNMQPPASSPLQSKVQYVYDTLTSDLRVICSTNVLARNFSQSERHVVYRYVITNIFSKRLNMGNQKQFSFHAIDLLALFGYHMSEQYRPGAADLKFVHLVQKHVKHILYFGHPITNEWRRFPLETAILDVPKVQFTGPKGYHHKQCKFWMDHGFFPYGWIN